MKHVVLGVLIITLFTSAMPNSATDAATASTTTPDISPHGIHLSYGKDATTTLKVVWTTIGSDPGTFVEFGPTADLGTVSTGHAMPALGVDRWIHEATMTSAGPATAVHYRVGSPSGWSPIYETRTAPPAGVPTNIVAIGDHGTGSWAVETTQAVLDHAPDLVVIAGDISYAEEDHEEWDLYFDQLEPLATRVPIMPAIGNHGYVPPHGTKDFRDRFALPDAELYYSFDHGGFHFLALQSDLLPAIEEGIWEEMMAFAEADLADAAERRADGEIDHIAVIQHHPLYSNRDSTSRRVQADQAVAVERLLHRYDVKLLVVGHNHNYERSYPMVYMTPTTVERSEYVDPVGFIQLTTGGGGRSLYSFVHPDDVLPWSAVREMRYHYTSLDVSGETLTATAISTGPVPGQVLDRFTLTDTDGPLETVASFPPSEPADTTMES